MNTQQAADLARVQVDAAVTQVMAIRGEGNNGNPKLIKS
jgi:hypothetical protein